MNRQERQLDQIQRWMQTVISAPGGVESGIASEAAQREIPLTDDQLESVITRSSRRVMNASAFMPMPTMHGCWNVSVKNMQLW